MSKLRHAGSRRIQFLGVVNNRRVSLIDFGLAAYTGQEGLQKDLDYACFGNLLLYLLYSGYHGPQKGAWYEELPLSQGQKDFLKRLFGLKDRFTRTEIVKKEFSRNFSPQNFMASPKDLL